MAPTRRQLLIGGGLVAGLTTFGGWRVQRRLGASAERALVVTRVDGMPEPPAGASLELLVTGDSGADTEVRREVVAALTRSDARIPADALLLTGDNVYPHGVTSVDDPAFETHFVQPFGALAARIPFYPCLGNHDHEGNAAAQVEYAARNPDWRLPAAYHSFTLPVTASVAAEVFVIDTMPLRTDDIGFLRRPAQVEWLDDALGRSTAAWKIVVGHHPLVSGGPKGGSSSVRWHLTRVFAEHAVDLYVSGHDHALELLDPGGGTLQVVSGAGAAPETHVDALDETLFHALGGGFCRISVRADVAWIEFESTTERLAAFRVERR